MSPNRLRLLIAVAIAVLLYGLAGFLLAPALVRSNLLGGLDHTLTTRPTLARARVNPFALSVTLERLAIPDAQGRTVAGFERLYVRFDPLRSIFLRAWTLSELRIERPALTLEILPDRTLNLMHLLRPQPASADSGGEPPAIRIRRFRLSEGAIRYADGSRQPYFRKSLAPIEFDLTDFGTRRDSRNEYSFEARSDLRETLAWRGRFRLQPFASDGELRVGDLRASTLADLMGTQVPFVLTRGTLTLHAHYAFDAARTPVTFALSAIGSESRDLALADRASGDEVIAAGALDTQGGAYDFAHGTLALGDVHARDARLALTMLPDGHLNLERWAQPGAPDTGAALVTTIHAATIANLALAFDDRRLAPPARLIARDAHVELTDFSTAPGSAFHVALACSLGTGGHATAAGLVTPSAPSADLAIDVRGFALKAIEPYVQAFARLDITRGTVDANGRLLFNAFGAKGPLLRFVGDASSRTFAAVDRKVGKDFLTWKQLEFKHLEYDALPGRLVLHEVVATQPFIRMIVAPDRTTNVQALATPPDSVPMAFRPVPGQGDTMPVRIDIVRVLNGSTYFADLSLTPNFATGIQGLNGTIRELSSAESAHAEVQLDGKVDAYAPASITGTLNPLNGRGRTDLDVSFKNIELTTFSPYSGKFMGYRITKGKLDLDLNYKIADRQLDASNKVFMRQLTLGDKVPSADATKLPVRFAIALLKDRDGNIDLNLPVKGSLDDPKFSVFPLIMKVLIGLVTKAVASPFALLGAVFGGGSQDAPAVAFAYGSAELDTSGTKVLEAVRKGLADKPALKLEIEEPGQADGDSLALLEMHYARALRETGAQASAAASAAQIVAARRIAPAEFPAEQWVPLVTRAYAARIGKAPAAIATHGRRDAAPDSLAVAAEARRLLLMDGQLRARLPLDPLELATLARRRARHVQDFLLADSTIAPERVFITNGHGGARSDSLGVKLSLTLTD